MKAWSHLPNAHHIDWVLKSVKERHDLWIASRSVASDAVCIAARSAVWDVASRCVSWDAITDAAWDAVLGSTMVVTRDAAWDAILALIVYDDCDHFLNMDYEKLKVWAILSEDHRAVLLLPMVYVKEKLANLNLQPA